MSRIDGFGMQMIGNFLSFASRGDRVGLNDMLRQGMSPNVQDYDARTALHLAASEGHASIVELLLAYNADVNLRDRWLRTPLADAKLYQHRDICRILELNGGRDLMEDHGMVVETSALTTMINPASPGYEICNCLNYLESHVCHEDNPQENIDISELKLQNSSIIKQGLFGESEKVKWRGTCVVKTVISRHINHPVDMFAWVLTAKDNTLLGELRHPNILEFLGSIVHGEEMILITEYLPKGNLDDLLAKKVKLDPATCLRYALDIARGMNYLHQHKPRPIVHNNLDTRNLLIDEGDQVKIGEYWIQMLYERIHPNSEKSCLTDPSDNLDASYDTNKDIYDFGFIFCQMLEGKQITNMYYDSMHLKSAEFEKKFNISRCPGRIFQLIEQCASKDSSPKPSFDSVIEILEEVILLLKTTGCNVCFVLD